MSQIANIFKTSIKKMFCHFKVRGEIHSLDNAAYKAPSNRQGANLHLGLIHQTDYIMSNTFHFSVCAECRLIMPEIGRKKLNTSGP